MTIDEQIEEAQGLIECLNQCKAEADDWATIKWLDEGITKAKGRIRVLCEAKKTAEGGQ